MCGNFEQAIYDFRQALRYAQPEDCYSMYDWIFSSYVEMGDMESARKLLQDAPDDQDVPDMDWD